MVGSQRGYGWQAVAGSQQSSGSVCDRARVVALDRNRLAARVASMDDKTALARMKERGGKYWTARILVMGRNL